MSKPLEDVLIIDFSQFLSGPSASLRLADLGARVIKIERPGSGDISRKMYISNVIMNGDSSIFHAINRNKESLTADLKNQDDVAYIKELIKKADVVIHNFRPGVMDRLGLDYQTVKKLKPDIIYGEISGYGTEGPWRAKPGQDLLLQAISGLCTLSGNGDRGPVPMGISVVDITVGAHLVQGVLACLFRKGITGEGGRVEVNMLESACDLQFESLTSFYNDGGQPVQRSLNNNANAYLGAPYGIYKTKDGYLALAMTPISTLAKMIDCEALSNYPPETWFEKREEIKSILAGHLETKKTNYWLSILEPGDIWCAEVFSWEQLMRHEGFRVLDMIQTAIMKDGYAFKTTRCPIEIDRQILFAKKGTPKLGEDTKRIIEQMIKSKEVNAGQS